jgi:cupin 2 domain-containing protein
MATDRFGSDSVPRYPGGLPMVNLFDDLPARAHEEIVTELLLRKDVRIERIVSTGQSTPADKPYNQDHDEWVLLLTGSAGLWIEGQGERGLRPGDHVLIPAHCLHRVTRTANSGPTVWLAVHLR